MTLASSFELGQRPVVMFNLDFDGGSINVWTRPATGEHDGITYSPLAGLTSSFSVLNSLIRSSPDASAQISGSAEEIITAALTENFQLRDATVRLGNLSEDRSTVEESEVILPGRMQDIPVVLDPVAGRTVAVQIASVFSDLTEANDLRYSAADQAKFDSEDTFFDFVETAETQEPAFGA